jgi:hypothetical protein
VDDDGSTLEGGDAASKAISVAPGLAKYAWMIRSKAGVAVARAVYAGLRTVKKTPLCCPGENSQEK